jgi:transposase
MGAVIRFFDLIREARMSGKSPVAASDEQRAALRELAGSKERAEADRARAILLTLAGWTSARIAQAFGVREDTVRLWRSDFLKSGVDGLKTRVAAGPAPIKAQAALRVADDVLTAPVANRRNWTLPRLIAEIEQREGVRISKSRLSVVLRKKGGTASAARGTRSRVGKTPMPSTAQGCGSGC